MREKDSAILFRHWLRANPWHTCTFEMKDTLGKDYLNFSEVKQEQLDYATAIEGVLSDKGVLMRMQAVSTGMPDYAYFRKSPSYIVIKYPKGFAVIRATIFLGEKTISPRKSLTSSRAKDLSTTWIKTG